MTIQTPVSLNSLAKSYMKIVKRVGLSVSPCLTQIGQLNQSVGLSLSTTLDLGSLYRADIAEYILPTIPILESLKSSRVLSTESNALEKSIKARKVSLFCDFLFLKIVIKVKIWSMQDLAALLPFCSSASKLLLSRYFCSLLFNIVEYIFATQHIIVIGLLLSGILESLSFLGTGFMLL